jgi:predicted TIM-barrel fold metal-dependent hydrolase
MIFMKKYFRLLSLLLFCACSSHYTMEDFVKVKKIDAHFHLNTTDTFAINQAIADNFDIISLNTDAYGGLNIERQDSITDVLHKMFPDKINYMTTFSMNGFKVSGWQNSIINKIDKAIQNGAVGVKMWKNIGTIERDTDSTFIMIDNPIFDPLLSYLEKNEIPVTGHFGDPKNGWLPVEKMTIRGDSNYFCHHPEFHFFKHPEIPDYDFQNDARNRMLDKHPKLIFVGAHLASLEWDVDTLAELFEKYPNSYVDIAGRNCYFELQAKDNWQKVHDFLIEYHDRILYGTDMGTREHDQDPNGTKVYIHGIWLHDWRFFTTDDNMQCEQFDGTFNGMNLPKNIIDDIYYNNAKRIFLNHKIKIK